MHFTQYGEKRVKFSNIFLLLSQLERLTSLINHVSLEFHPVLFRMIANRIWNNNQRLSWSEPGPSDNSSFFACDSGSKKKDDF
jgi:hypothetical protein